MYSTLRRLYQLSSRLKNRPSVSNINVNGLLNVLDASKDYVVKKFVLSSSAAVYGDNPVSPQNDRHETGPENLHNGITKLDGELYLAMYHDL